MKIVFIILLLINSINIIAQVSLAIEIKELRNNNGKILFQLYDNNQNKIKGVYGDISNNKCLIVIKELKKGKYAFKYFHDENTSEELDSNWLGLPTEGYGFSNNAVGKFGPPSFDQWLFELKENKKMVCLPTY